MQLRSMVRIPILAVVFILLHYTPYNFIVFGAWGTTLVFRTWKVVRTYKQNSEF